MSKSTIIVGTGIIFRLFTNILKEIGTAEVNPYAMKLVDLPTENLPTERPNYERLGTVAIADYPKVPYTLNDNPHETFEAAVWREPSGVLHIGCQAFSVADSRRIIAASRALKRKTKKTTKKKALKAAA